MRRAVAACMAPWDYFNLPVPDLAFDRTPKEDQGHGHGLPHSPRKRAPSDAGLQQTIQQLRGMAM